MVSILSALPPSLTAMNLPFSAPAPGGRILLMDDDGLLLRIVAAALRTAGHTVDVATDGDIAVQLHRDALLAGTPYDLLILDLKVRGGLGGPAALARIRMRQPTVRALVSSAWAHHPDMMDHAANGFAGTLVKPYGEAHLLATVGEALAA